MAWLSEPLRDRERIVIITIDQQIFDRICVDAAGRHGWRQ